MAALPTSFTLNTGAKMPSVGLGCWVGVPGADVIKENQGTTDMCMSALKLGYRHLDTAEGYGNQQGVGRAVRECGLPRDQIFVTTKLNDDKHGDVQKGFQQSLDELNVEYIDLWLMHWPMAKNPETSKHYSASEGPTFVETWRQMEKMLESGKVKAIGVSNFSRKNLEVLLKEAKVVPAVNQVECHPYLPQNGLAEYCASKGIVLTAYCPLGMTDSPMLKDPLIESLATKYGVPAGTIALAWNVQRGWIVVPKSATPSRQEANLKVIKLEEADHEAISKLHEQPDKLRPFCRYGKDCDAEKKVIFNWTFSEMGWDDAHQG